MRVSARSDEHTASNWPAGIDADQCFLVQSPNRIVYFHTENAESAKTWVEKIQEAKEKVHLGCCFGANNYSFCSFPRRLK